jgi:hypothetical protein
VLRWLHTLPKQGSRAPWRLYQNYACDVLKLRRGPLEDEGIEFSNPRARGAGRAAGCLAARTGRPGLYAFGWMFWFTRNALSGSYFALIRASRS